MKKIIFIVVIVYATLVGLAGYFILVEKINPIPVVGGINPKAYGFYCEKAGSCNNLVAINCKAEVDGPFYYVDAETGEITEYCGGYCMVDSEIYCKNCPPKKWT